MRLLLAGAPLLAAPVAGQRAVLNVRVLDEDTGAAIAGAEVVLEGRPPVTTDSAGRLVLRGVAPGERELKAGRLGYRPQRIVVRVPGSGVMEVEVALRTQPLALPDLLIITKRMDSRLRAVRFYERRRLGLGVGWDWRELRDGSRDPRDFLNRLPGFSVRAAGGDTAWVLESHRGPGLSPCMASVLLDGQPADARRLGSLQLDQVAAMEAYLGPATTPAEIAALTSDSRCGVVAIWTRTGS